MKTEAFSQNIDKLFSELKLVTDNLLIDVYTRPICVHYCQAFVIIHTIYPHVRDHSDS